MNLIPGQKVYWYKPTNHSKKTPKKIQVTVISVNKLSGRVKVRFTGADGKDAIRSLSLENVEPVMNDDHQNGMEDFN